MRRSRHGLVILAVCAAVLSNASPSAADEARARMESLSRSVVAQNSLIQDEAEPTPVGGLFQGDIGARFKHSFWSLIIPGWSQYRGGQTTRAAVYAGVELGIWTSYGVFQLQGHRRRDSYEEWAVQFAGVSDTDHDDGYWRSVALFVSNDDYNESVRRDLRIGIDPEGPFYEGDDGWLWRSEARRQDYRVLRAQSQDAFDRANLTLLFAVLNRVISFVDALRSAPVASSEFSQPPPEGVKLGLDVAPSDEGPITVVHLKAAF